MLYKCFHTVVSGLPGDGPERTGTCRIFMFLKTLF